MDASALLPSVICLVAGAACCYALWRELKVRWPFALLAVPIIATLTASLSFWLPAVIAAAAVSVLVVCVLICEIDRRHFIIPDVLVAALLLIALVAPLTSRIEQVIGAAVTGLMFLAVRIGFRQVRGLQGLGLGDVKLAAAMGALLGPTLALAAVAVAAGSTAIMLAVQKNTANPAPFGIGLSAALAIALFVEAWR